jgi:glucose/arabinose dehydrogenase
MRQRRFGSSTTSNRHRGQRLRVELLEPRLLLAGDTYLINFQLDEATPPTRYHVDSGQLFGVRDGGLSYGWSSDHSDQSRERSANPDQRLDTLVHFEIDQNWEFALANGVYEVTASIGDPSNASTHTLNVEGVNYWNAVALAANAFNNKTMTVTVSDGRLTLNQGDAADKSTRINYVHVVGLADGPNAAPALPTITEPGTDGQEVHPADVHMEAIGFSDSDGNLHKSTDWEIWTTGAGAHPVWQTLGIEGLEKLHTHFGDGVFINSRAGQISLASNADHELRVRFRDDAGSVSGYAVRSFHTSAESTVFPLEIIDVAANPAPAWEDPFGTPIDLPSGASILSPGDPILGIDLDGGSNSPGNETPADAIDGTLDKYLNFGEVNSGFIVTPSSGSSTVTSFQITTANDAEERDPAMWQLFGTNDAITSTDDSTGSQENWTLIDSGSIALPGVRDTLGPIVSVDNDTAYTSYRMIFTEVKNEFTANSMQIAEIQFFGEQTGTPTPPSMRLESGSAGELLLSFEGTDLPGNLVGEFAPLADHAALRVVVQAGTSNLLLGPSNLNFTDENGGTHTVFLPDVSLPAGERLDLWVSTDGSTYYGTALQTEPDFSLLARPSTTTLTNPFVALQAGYVVEVVATNMRLPVNIAFVPDPGPNPDDPLYYVTELYGSIQVVTRDGTRHEFATGLLDYNPQGPISGTGEQGLTGIAVQRDALNPEIYHLYVGMLWDNGAPPGGLVHYPKVERIDSAPGGLTMDSRTVLLNMQPETQGQSHQISNVSIGPDGMLYVHNGDGFNTGTAQNLDQFRGKILRMNLDGTAPSDNPFYDAANGITARDYVFAYGVRNPFGGAWRASDGKHYEVENGPSVDRLAQIVRGRNYLWSGSDQSMENFAIYNWDPAHAPVNMTFIQRETFGGSQFPASKMDHLFVSESGPTYATGPQSRGKRIVEFELDANGELVSGPTTLVEYVGTGQSTVVGIAAGPDGLYFTELYEDTGAAGPTAVGARVYRVRYVDPTPLAGDYDLDDVVDQDDYAIWKSAFGSNLLTAADGNGNGVVDTADYTVWRDNRGATLPGTGAAAGSSSAVPSASSAEGQAAAVAVTPTQQADTDVARASALVELALESFFLKAAVEAAPSSGVRAVALTTSDSSADEALLLTLSEFNNTAEGQLTAIAAEADRLSDDVELQGIDDLFAIFELELLH